jgi:flagellar hook-associated protein 3 FlgL
MRISFAMQTGTTIQSLDSQQQEITSLSNAISSGNKMTSPSDDPYSWARSMDVKHGLQEYDSVLQNVSFATGWNNTTDSALNQLNNLVSQARQAAISATSPTGTAQTNALTSQIDGIIKQAVNIMNSQYGNQYVFGGSATGTPPYSIDSSGNVTYNGDSNAVNIRTQRGNGTPTAINVTGTAVTSYPSGGSPTDLFTELNGLKQAIASGNQANTTSKLTTLQDAMDNISNQSSLTGNRLANFSTQTSAINSLKTNDQSTLSDLSDTDLTSAVVKLQQQQTAYQAAAKATGLMGSLSLANLLSTL